MYELKRKRKEQEKSQNKTEVKEMRLTYVTDDHDVEFKVRHAINWLRSGDKVRCIIRFRGRTIQFRDMGEVLLLRVSQMLEEFGKVEMFPKMDGKMMSMIVAPKKTNGAEKRMVSNE